MKLFQSSRTVSWQKRCCKTSPPKLAADSKSPGVEQRGSYYITTMKPSQPDGLYVHICCWFYIIVLFHMQSLAVRRG